MAFSTEKSHITQEAMDEWLRLDLGDGDLVQVPGIGKATKVLLQSTAAQFGKMQPQVIENTYQLLGCFLMLMDTDSEPTTQLDRMKDFLSKSDTSKTHQDSIVHAIASKLQQGVTISHSYMGLTEDLTSSSRMDQGELQSFIKADLSGSLGTDFKGIGPVSQTKLAAQGIETTWQLFGHFLMLNSERGVGCGKFIAFLKSVGVASSWINTIVVQVALRLLAGLGLPSIGVFQNEDFASISPEKGRVGKLTPMKGIAEEAAAPAAAAPAAAAPAAAAPASTKTKTQEVAKPAASNNLMMYVILVFVAYIYFKFF